MSFSKFAIITVRETMPRITQITEKPRGKLCALLSTYERQDDFVPVILAGKYPTVVPGLLPGPGVVPKGSRNGPIASACMLCVSHSCKAGVAVAAADDAAGTVE
jgi:hypothetical protein